MLRETFGTFMITDKARKEDRQNLARLELMIKDFL